MPAEARAGRCLPQSAAWRLQRVAIAKLVVDRLILPLKRLKIFGKETVCLRQLDIQIGVELVFFVG